MLVVFFWCVFWFKICFDIKLFDFKFSLDCKWYGYLDDMKGCFVEKLFECLIFEI